jgi:hypothetical protein
MKVVQIKKSGLYLPLGGGSMNEIDKKGNFNYFIRGNGWKKTKSFTVIEDDFLLNRGEDGINELYIGKVFDKYGIEVAETYANCITAGIVARQTAYGYGVLYQKIKNILPSDFDNSFFKLLKCDYWLACFGLFSLDIVWLDDYFMKNDVDYDNVKCTYKGTENVSLREYITLKYGVEYANLIDVCCKA